MNKKLLYTFLTTLLILNGVLIYLVLDSKIDSRPPKGRNFLTQELGFTARQNESFLKLDRAHRRRMRAIDNKLSKQLSKLFNSLDREQNEINKLSTQIGELETLKHKELASFFSDVRRVCNSNQQKVLDQILQELVHRRGPKPPRRDRRNPPPRPDF